MGQLPKCRIEKSVRPFAKCGIDYFGPIEITVGRKHEKRYGVIFTCMAIRAIHIEIAHDLSFNGFMHVFRQFGNRRGFPSDVYSDNGTNFHRSDKEIKNVFKSWPEDDLIKFSTSKMCNWHFNPPAAPHMGGVWERLIQSIKKHLKFVLTEKYPKEYVLRTLFCEIEMIINSRPLTFNSDDPHDSNPLTPNDLLIGPNLNNFPFSKTDDNDLTPLTMWRASQRLADIFWKRWVGEYLPTVLQSRKWTREVRNVSVGDVVIIFDGDMPRSCWPKGKVVKTYPGPDGYVRVVDVQTVSGIFKRSIAKIVKLSILN